MANKIQPGRGLVANIKVQARPLGTVSVGTEVFEVYVPMEKIDDEQEEMLADDIAQIFDEVEEVVAQKLAELHPDLRYVRRT